MKPPVKQKFIRKTSSSYEESSNRSNRFDRFDLQILRELTVDSRQTLQQLGQKVSLSPTACWSRIKRLEAEGVIRRYTVDLDHSKIGWQDTVIVQLTLESHTDEALYEFGKVLATIPEILEASLVSGEYDYFIRIAVRDTRDYERLLREKLYRIPGIRHSKSHFVLRVLKDGGSPLDATDTRGDAS
jgi:Lrp/AsnC family leucine-responsive transcriptional regulator